MIYKDFIYIKPNDLEEAYNIYKDYSEKGKKVYYYSGGTEILTFSRKGIIEPDVLIDLKNIKDCKDFYFEDDNLVIGSVLPLNTIVDSNYSKILSKSLKFIADHTVRNRITIGGNILGQLPFREAILPLLCLDANLKIFTDNVLKDFEINKIFDKNLKLNKGDILVQILIKKEFLNYDFYYDRKVFYTKVDYPILSTLFVKFSDKLRMAITGAFNFPLRSFDAENILNDNNLKKDEKIERLIDFLFPLFKSDLRSSKEYRIHLFKTILLSTLNHFGG